MVTALSCCIRFFFFQAEDGIRDVAVTGVQTCALPIFRRAGYEGRFERGRQRRRAWGEQRTVSRDGVAESGQQSPTRPANEKDVLAKIHCRSEERRVGKECRSR